jgi:hypothetical protein
LPAQKAPTLRQSVMVMGRLFLETGNSFQDPEKFIFDRRSIVFYSLKDGSLCRSAYW